MFLESVHSRILIKLNGCRSWQKDRRISETIQQNLERIFQIIADKIVRKVGFESNSLSKLGVKDSRILIMFLIICYIPYFATKRSSHHQNPTARSKSYWALGAQVPTQFPRLGDGIISLFMNAISSLW